MLRPKKTFSNRQYRGFDYCVFIVCSIEKFQRILWNAWKNIDLPCCDCSLFLYLFDYFFFVIKAKWTTFIKGISIANLLYCILTIGLIIFYHPQLTTIGIAYFLGEIAIICGLVYIELNVANEINKSRIGNKTNDWQGNTAGNSTYKKLAVQYLNEV